MKRDHTAAMLELEMNDFLQHFYYSTNIQQKHSTRDYIFCSNFPSLPENLMPCTWAKIQAKQWSFLRQFI